MDKPQKLLLIYLFFAVTIILFFAIATGQLLARSPMAVSDNTENYLPLIYSLEQTPTPSPTNTPIPTNTPVPTNTPASTNTPTPTNTPAPTNTPVSMPTRPPGVIAVDHTSVALFDQIPAQYVQAAASLRMLFVDRSVGGNISDGLSCLSVPWENAPNHCKRWEHTGDSAFSVDPSEVSWTGSYDRSNWVYLFWPIDDPSVPDISCSVSTGEWYGKAECFEEYAASNINSYEVLSFQYSYLSVDESSSIADLPGGFFSNNADRYDVFDFAQFEAQNPSKDFIYWTTSLSRGIGTHVSESFNEQMRIYALSNGKILFDVADILSHDPDGNPCYDNRDGIPYSFGNQSENHPDDGVEILAICPHYTTEVDGGHLGSVSAGKIRVAKAFWVLMAQIAGWNP